MKNITREAITNDTIWAIELDDAYGRHWVTGPWAEVEWAFNSEDLSDCDLCANQPEHLKPFFDAYWAYDKAHGFTTVQEFMDIYFKEAV